MPSPTPPLDRTTALGVPLGAYAGWSLLVRCPQCRSVRVRPVRELAVSLCVAAFVARLRCQTCRTRPDWIQLREGEDAAGMREVKRVQLVDTARPVSRDSSPSQRR